MIPAKRNVATPQAVACLTPFLLACQKTAIEIKAEMARVRMKGPGLMFPSTGVFQLVTAPRNSSIESAETVWIFALPRAPSATETRAMAASSAASTTFTKSKGPRVAHWCSTFAPSSSTSRFTSRRRSGLDFSVCTPWAVSVVSRM